MEPKKEPCYAGVAEKVEEASGKKKKRNRRNKKKALDSLTNELLNNLDTDDLVDFINNCGAKKEDIRKTAANSSAA